MAQISKEIVVDVAKKNLFQAIVAKQNDNNSRFLKVTICDEGVKIPVPQDANVVINAERADRQSKAFSGTVNTDGTVTVPLTSWMLELDDTIRCSISILGNDSKLTSTTFYVDVEPSEYSDSAISTDDKYDILTSLINAMPETTITISSSSTDDKIPTAKAVWDLFGTIINGNEVSY